MSDLRKTKAQLVEELAQLRKRVAELEAERALGTEPASDASEKKFRALAESSIAHISIVQDDRHIYANQAFLDYHGLDLEELRLITPEDLMVGMISPQVIQEVAPAVEAAMARGETHFSFDVNYLDGSWFQTDVTIMELDGKETSVMMAFDITAHKRAQEALAESEKKFRALAESTTAQIMITAGDRFVYANRAALDHMGMTWEELSKQSPNDLLVGEEDDSDECEAWADDQIKAGGGRFRTVYSQPDAQGVERWFEAHVSRLEIDSEPAFISTAFDITELKRAQQEMYRADKMAALGQIVAGVAHEINNPNNFIYFNLPILRRYVEAMAPLLETQPDQQILGMELEAFLADIYKLLENMEHGSVRITKIVSDLKNYVRSDADPERREGPVEPVVDRVMTLVGKQVRKMVKHLEVEVAKGLPPVMMNTGKIEQVLINLLINAGHAADKEDSRVRLTARTSEQTAGWVEICVEDNGAGVPADKLDKIFEPFYTSKGPDQGTGLGLSISHRIVEEHGGRLTVESTPGESTRFTVLLPPASEAPAPPP